jgi:hypothetical protein
MICQAIGKRALQTRCWLESHVELTNMPFSELFVWPLLYKVETRNEQAVRLERNDIWHRVAVGG